MAVNRYDREVRDGEYLQRVRRHPPSGLLPLVAAASARYPMDGWESSPGRRYTPWALADVARVSLAYGNEKRGGVTDEDDLLSCLCAYSSLGDPTLTPDSGAGELFAFFLRLCSEQLPFQRRAFGSLARTMALFEQTMPARELEVIRQGWDEEVLGASLENYVRTALLLQAGAVNNLGTFDLAWLDQPNFEEILQTLPRDAFLSALTKQFVTDPVTFRKDQDSQPALEQEYRRFGHNPLWARPVVRSLGESLLIPVIDLLALKVSPLGIFYSGVAAYGEAFSRDLGHLVEAYVGRQLRLLPANHDVRAAITYGRDKRQSVDWIVIGPGVTVLIEVKSVRPTEAVRLGTAQAASALQRMLGKAHTQIAETARLVRSRQAEFAVIPDQPMLGLVVTLEPFDTLYDPFRVVEFPAPGVPTAICSIADLEFLVGADSDPFLLLTRQHEESGQIDVRRVLTGRPIERNAVLDAAFGRYSWLRSTSQGLDA
ncbi:hypothetical protein [Cellulosimicrobium cellulans]|uniref:hypothetical protein n=1 Tax=Cellulosimicrobium cellulans TaxID=1710 RepID=UPI002097CC11|nr:hypothetical protein [Cellulosimicrobium cellulans]MCO7273343.1 hypothetical protein [Cellulosimicrobium cellulans]